MLSETTIRKVVHRLITNMDDQDIEILLDHSSSSQQHAMISRVADIDLLPPEVYDVINVLRWERHYSV